MKIYYLDTSIWLDFFENRDEPNLPKETWAKKLIEKIIREDGRIAYSNLNISELKDLRKYSLKRLLIPEKDNICKIFKNPFKLLYS